VSLVFPKVSVLIVSYNVKQYIIHCIDSIKKSDYTGQIEIIVIDNNSFDGSLDAIKSKIKDVICIQNDVNVGFGKAINQVAKVATGEYFLILNPDTIIEESTISTFVNYLSENSAVGMVGPKIVNSDGSLQKGSKRSFPTIGVALPKLIGLDNIFPKSKWAGRYNLNYLNPDEIHKVDAISGSCMFIRSKLFNKIGGFDERFFMFGEDLDLCFQVYQQKFNVHYLPTTHIMHYQGESVKSAPYDSLNAFYQAMILFSEKHFSKGRNILTKSVIRSGIFIRKLVSIVNEKRSQIISIALDALVVLIAFLIAFPLRLNSLDAFVVSKGLIPGVYIIFWIMVCALFELYSRYILSYTRAILASLSGFILAVVFTYFFKQYAFSRLVIIAATTIITILIPGWRIVAHYLMSRGVLKPTKEKHHVLFARKTIIMGTDNEAIKIAKNIQKKFDTGLDIVGFVDHKLTIEQEKLFLPFLGLVSDLRDIVTKHNIHEIIFSTDSFSNQEILDLMDETKDLQLTYRIVPRNQEVLLGKASVEDVGDYSFVNIEYNLYHRLHKFTKRIFDIVFTVLLSVLLSPIAIISALTKKIERIEFWGVNGKKFTVLVLKSTKKINQKYLYLYSILKGDMSFVGSLLIPTSQTNPNLICKPGLTGLAKMRNSKFTQSDRNVLDHYYVQNQSLTLDIEIILKTIFRN
jgi:GT2 family glycosyltransferase/lipopolysaccharide/colanic/teichoic acid biosynthesis glycosyltransferase